MFQITFLFAIYILLNPEAESSLSVVPKVPTTAGVLSVIITSQSSQYNIRNYNALALPMSISPVVASSRLIALNSMYVPSIPIAVALPVQESAGVKVASEPRNNVITTTPQKLGAKSQDLHKLNASTQSQSVKEKSHSIEIIPGKVTQLMRIFSKAVSSPASVAQTTFPPILLDGRVNPVRSATPPTPPDVAVQPSVNSVRVGIAAPTSVFPFFPSLVLGRI